MKSPISANTPTNRISEIRKKLVKISDMKIHDSAFYFIFFFLSGVLSASINLKFSVILILTALTAVLFLLLRLFYPNSRINLKWLSVLSLIMAVGAIYYFWGDFQMNKNFRAVLGRKINFSGIVADYPQKGASQKLTINLNPPYGGKILATLRLYPSFGYGDEVAFNGILKEPTGSYADYLKKNGILATSDYPQATLVKTGQGSKIKSALFNLKEGFVLSLQKILPQEEAALASGITLGERSEFSKDLKTAMSNSGTTHIVALSGYNITIIVSAVAFALAIYFSRKTTFIITLAVILGFVLMTGAEASVVRAALMGSVALLGKRIGRVYSFRNALSVSAFLMVLENPKILVFDIGFQLSFLALLGLFYISPAIKKLFKIGGGEISEWKDILISTISAQLAVLPVLISSFGGFSAFSVVANVLILWLMPFTMAVGFLAGFAGFLSYYFSLLLGWFLHLFLYYELAVINFFGKAGLPIKTSLNFFWSAVYFVLIAGFIIWTRRKKLRISHGQNV